MNPTPSSEQSRHLAASDGIRLHYRAWPVESPRAALLVVHGLFEHSRRYQELAATLGGAGIATFGLDLRGHGQSGGRRGHVNRFELFLEDVDRFRREATARLPDGCPVFLLGHSMGGLITLRYLEERQPPVQGAVLTSPWLAMTEEIAGWERALAALLNRLLPRLAYPAGLDPDDLSHDPERVADYRNDPLIYSKLTGRLFHEVQQAWKAVFERSRGLRVPLLFLPGGADRVADPDRTRQLARAIDAPDVTIHVLEGYYHEVLQETDRAAVMAEILAWIEARLP